MNWSRSLFRFLLASALASLLVAPVQAQSGSRGPRGSGNRRSAPPSASGNRAAAGTAVALEGYCPVCVMEMKKWVPGNAQFAVRYDGKVYYFPGEKQKQMFLANPAKYVPALGGDCVVCLSKMHKRVPGNIRYAAFYHGRLYLFPSEEQRAMFREHPAQYADADLALGGNCVVCMVDMNQQVPGKPEYTAIYHGMRYQFPGEEQMKKFLASPEKYAAAARQRQQASVRPTSTSGATTASLVRVRGKSGCAGCDYGQHPLRDPDELGLAVTTDDGTVFIVEDAHKRYPQLYERRFDGVPLEVVGQVLKREGQFVWIEPQEVKAL